MNISQFNYSADKTIYALSTVFGQSAISIIRISGKNALDAIYKFNVKTYIKPKTAHLVELKSDDDVIIDHCLLLFFQNPNSFTGEDLVEFHLHGSKAVINAVLQGLSEIDNFQVAEPGEFTRRAFLNGKMDLVQAEGLIAVIHAETHEQLIQANKQLSGENSRIFNSIRNKILQIFANCEAMLDFPEDDIGDNKHKGTPRDMSEDSIESSILNQLKEIHIEIKLYLNDNRIGERIENGFKIVIVGEPNVGKSSLINYLAKKPIAIVSEFAGTTRDLVRVNLNIDGYAVELIDTAGIRETEDLVESIGVELAKNTIQEADLIIVLSELSSADNYKNFINEVDLNKHIFVINKMDDVDNGFFKFNGIDYIAISIEKERNMDILMNEIKRYLLDLFSSNAPLITSKRQRILLEKLEKDLTTIIENYWQYQFLDILTEDIRNLANYVSQLTGDISTDDVLNELFNNFCIGK